MFSTQGKIHLQLSECRKLHRFKSQIQKFSGETQNHHHNLFHFNTLSQLKYILYLIKFIIWMDHWMSIGSIILFSIMFNLISQQPPGFDWFVHNCPCYLGSLQLNCYKEQYCDQSFHYSRCTKPIYISEHMHFHW